MKSKHIESVSVALVSDRLLASVKLAPGAEEGLEFAFYVYRNDERVHIEWYSKKNTLEYEVGYVPGYYRVLAFAKTAGNVIESSKSALLFINPVVVDKTEIGTADLNKVAYVLKGKHWKFPAMYFPHENNRLFVLMPSAVDRTAVTLPVFSRWTWALKGIFPGDVLCIADPTLTLHPDLALGWCLGTKANCATNELVELVTALAEARKIPFANIVIWGSSAGGFAALALAARIPGSTAVAINAQTDAFAYQVTKQVDLVNQACFGGSAIEQTRADFAARLDMVTRWSENQVSRAILVQNELDVHHYDVHFKPFWNSLGGSVHQGWSYAGTHQAWVYRSPDGHVPETVEMALEIVSAVTSDMSQCPPAAPIGRSDPAGVLES